MGQVIVRYRVKPGQAAENQRLIERVFEELRQSQPAGLRYASFKEADGVSFMHIASIETESGDNPLAGSPAFQAFQAGIKERCDEGPAPTDVEVIGSYRVF